MTEKEKMLAGEWFHPNDAELEQDRTRARHLTHRLNVTLKDKDATYLATLRELCPGVEAMIRAPFYCDYGYNISIGKGSYVNFNCVFLDLGPIRLGQRCLIGPGVQLLTAVHPMDATERATGKEKGAGIEIGDDCWLGGGVIVCPGVKIGCRCVIGAGSVVTHDIPDNSVAAGNPAALSAPQPTNKSAASENRSRNPATASATTRCLHTKNCYPRSIYSHFFITLHVGKIRRRLPARNRRHTANSGAAEYDKDR